ncbi:MAG: hypothetical protein PHV85_08860 [Desulfovibrionaceae bacterium]|nr:hypothetical protein [Desulfovibrionaceae bacterium]MDD4952646.1 hypothetical protein [Desulfovibrionaceae bacterium]
MAEEHKKSRLDLSWLEDRLSEGAPPALRWLIHNLRPIIFAALGVVLAAAAVAGFKAYQSRALARANEDLGAILVKYSGQERIERLEKFLPQAPDELKTGVLFELAGECMGQKDYAKAAGFWKQLSAGPDRDVVVLAGLGRAKCLSLSGRPGEALGILSDLSRSAPEPYRMPVYRQLAAAAEEAGDLDAAISAYEELAGLDNSPGKQFLEFKVEQLKAARKDPGPGAKE